MVPLDDEGTYGKSTVEIYRGKWIKDVDRIAFAIDPVDEHTPYVRLTVIHTVYRKPIAG